MILKFAGKLVNRVLSLVFDSTPSTDPVSVTVGSTKVFGVSPQGNVTCGLVNNVDLSTLSPAEVTQAELDAVQAQVTALDTEVDGKASATDLTSLSSSYNAHDHGTTSRLADKDRIWQLQVFVPSVTNVGFKVAGGSGWGVNNGLTLPANIHIKRVELFGRLIGADPETSTLQAELYGVNDTGGYEIDILNIAATDAGSYSIRKTYDTPVDASTYRFQAFIRRNSGNVNWADIGLIITATID